MPVTARKRTSSGRAASSSPRKSNGRTPTKVSLELSDDDEEPVPRKKAKEVVEVDSDDDEDAEPEYEVEAIRDHRQLTGRQVWEMEYLIKWKNWPESDNTWEPEKNLHADLIDEYWKNHPAKAQRKKFEQSNAKKRVASSEMDEDDDIEPLEDEEDEEDEEEDDRAEVDLERKEKGMAKIREKFLEHYSKEEDWEDRVVNVINMQRDSEDSLLRSYLQFKHDPQWKKAMYKIGFPEEGKKGPALWVPNEQVNRMCPQKVIKFYEKHVKFSAPPK